MGARGRGAGGSPGTPARSDIGPRNSCNVLPQGAPRLGQRSSTHPRPGTRGHLNPPMSGNGILFPVLGAFEAFRSPPRRGHQKPFSHPCPSQTLHSWGTGGSGGYTAAPHSPQVAVGVMAPQHRRVGGTKHSPPHPQGRRKPQGWAEPTEGTGTGDSGDQHRNLSPPL